MTDSTWKSAEEVKLYFAKSDTPQSQATPEGTQVVVKPTFDIQIVLADDATYTIHSLDTQTVNGASSSHLKIDGESALAYLQFDGVEGFTTTLDNDKLIKENEARAAEEAKRAEEEAAAAAAAAAAAQEAAAQSYSYNNSNSSSSSSGGTTRNSGGSSQSENDCTGGFVTK